MPSIQYYFAKYPVLLWEVTNDAFSGQFYRDISHLSPSFRFSTQTESVVSMKKCILKCETVAGGVWEMSLSPKRGQTDDRLMNNYDFLILSPSEFERLTRDLLQKHLGCHVESFTQGRDGGVDLRYAGIKGKHASKRETNTNPTDNTNLQVSETYPCNPCNPCSRTLHITP